MHGEVESRAKKGGKNEFGRKKALKKKDSCVHETERASEGHLKGTEPGRSGSFVPNEERTVGGGTSEKEPREYESQPGVDSEAVLG